MKSWVIFAIFALILLFLLHNRTLEVERKLSEDRLKKGSRFLFIQRIVYESELIVETDPIIDSDHVLDADYSQEYVQQKSVQSRIVAYSDGSSGIDLRTTRKAFDYWIPMALKFATTAAVQVVHIPPIVKKKTNFRVTVKDLRVSHADILLDSYQLAAPDLLILSLTKGSMVLNGEYKIKVEFPPATKHGSITIILSDVSFKFAVQLSKNPQGILQAQIRQCSSSVGSIKIKVGNDIVRGLFNLYKGEFKSQANQHICPSLGQLVGMANSLLVKQTSFYNLPGGLKFDYSLTKNPEAHDAFLDFGLKGAFETAIGSQMEKMSELLSPVTDAPKRMALANIPDFTFNSFLFHATKAGLFNEVHLERTNDDIKRLLRLTCTEHERCIGRFSPNMSSTFVDNTGELILKIVTSPTVNIKSRGSDLCTHYIFICELYAGSLLICTEL
uniref:Uncharacterized protein n=1 Tax=Plectus sambesii TaxID=2011161 RepID=A0A914VQK8_9BILA